MVKTDAVILIAYYCKHKHVSVVMSVCSRMFYYGDDHDTIYNNGGVSLATVFPIFG